MSTFKDKLRKIFADTYYNDLEYFEYKTNNKDVPDIKKNYTYFKFQKSINDINKQNNLYNKDNPTKLISDLKYKNYHSNRPKLTSFNINEFVNNSKNPNKTNGNRTLIRSYSSMNFELKRTNSKIKKQLEATKSLIESNVPRNNPTNTNNNLNSKLNILILKSTPKTSFRNKPMRNLSSKLLDVNRDSIIGTVPINYKDSYTFKNSGSIFNRKYHNTNDMGIDKYNLNNLNRTYFK